MKYRIDPKTGKELSILGYGCMRLPSSLEETEKLVLRAIESGINYFDTAYIYGSSEERLGTVLSRNGLRERVNIATKLPVIMLRKAEDFDRFFDAQLRRLKTDYIDYYLMHMLPDKARWEQLCSWGILDWLRRKRDEGAIRQLGFSFHGSRQDFLELLDAHDWDFCQIQYNYSDENYQAGVAGLKRAAEKGLPVIIMEPLLGGKLVDNLPKRALDVFREADSSLSPAAWGLNWLWNQPEVTVVLSGMGAADQLEDNLRTAETAFPSMLGEEQLAAIARVRGILDETQKIPCTGCNYCMPCPKNVNIPSCFSAYNSSYSVGYLSAIKAYVKGTLGSASAGLAGQCVQCGRCEEHCPQGIEIRARLGDVKRRLEPFWFRWGLAFFRRFLLPRSK